MNQYSPIFADAQTPVGQIVQAVGADGWHASSSQVGVMQAAHAIDGEMWAPQLTPYKEWKPRGDGKVKGEHVGDLFSVGSLRMGATDELRERMVALGLEAARRMAEEQRLVAERQERHGSVDPDVIELPLVFGVKESNDGFVLSKVDLRQYAKRSGRESNLIVVLPSHVEGVPVVRIDADAFSRFNVRGIGVRLLVVPDTVRSIDAKAFSYLAAETIFVGAGCRHLGGQPLERWALKPAIRCRNYLVSEENAWWRSEDGGIMAKDGSELVFLAPPYAERAAIPRGVRHVGADAFAKWDSVPEVVECDSSLERVASKLWNGALWICPPDAPVFQALLSSNVRLASCDVQMVDGCWYDFDERGALLVAGPPAPPSVSQTFAHAIAASAKSSDGEGVARSAAVLAKQAAHAAPPATVLSVPSKVAGEPVVRVTPRALDTAPDTVILPEGLTSIGDDNACKGTRHVLLPQSLQRIGRHCFCSRSLEGVVSIPAGVLSVGEGCFEYATCRLEHTGTIVHVSANQLLNCFIERTEEEMDALRDADAAVRAPFDLERYDALLCRGENLPQRVAALVHRIASPVGLSDASRESMVSQLRDDAREAMEYIAREGDRETVARLADAGFIDEETFDEQIELLRRANRTDCVMLLMERHRQEAQPAASVISRFAL